MNIKRILLTDGQEVFEVRRIDDWSELDELNRAATEATDGNLHWVEDKRGYTGTNLIA